MRPLIASRATEWLDSLFGAIDGMDATAFGTFLTEDAVFRFGNAPAVHGRAAIEQAVRHFFASIRRSRHRLGRVWPGADAVAVEGTVTYTRLDGSEVTLPFADTFVLRGERISEYNIYVDIAPLYGTQR
jgi:ketosteroid isomerase-like protein